MHPYIFHSFIVYCDIFMATIIVVYFLCILVIPTYFLYYAVQTALTSNLKLHFIIV